MNHRDRQSRADIRGASASAAGSLAVDPGHVTAVGRRRRRRAADIETPPPARGTPVPEGMGDELPPDLAAAVDEASPDGRAERQRQAGDPTKNPAEGVTADAASEVSVRGGGGQAAPVDGERTAAAPAPGGEQAAPAQQEAQTEAPQSGQGGESEQSQAGGEREAAPAVAGTESAGDGAGVSRPAAAEDPQVAAPGTCEAIPVISVDVVHEREVGGWKEQRDRWRERHPNAPPAMNPYEWENLSSEQQRAETERGKEHMRIESQLSSLRDRVSGLYEQATSKRDALLAHAESLKAAMDSEIAIYEASIVSAASESEVAVVTEAAVADAEIEAGAAQAAGNLAAAEVDVLGRMAGDESAMCVATESSFAQAESQIAGLETAETAAFSQLLLTLAAEIDQVTADSKARAEAAGTQAAQTHDPSQYDGSPMGAYQAGLESLKADVKRKIAVDTAKEAGDAAEGATKPVADQLRTEADQLATNAVVPYTQAATSDIAPTSERASEQLASAATSARAQAEAGGETARQSIDASRRTAQSEVAGHRERSRVRFSGKARVLVDHLRAMGTEFKTNLETSALGLANGYAATVTSVKEDVEAAETAEQAAALVPSVEYTISSLEAQHTEDVAALDEAFEVGVSELDAFVAGQEGALAQAVAEDIRGIREARGRNRVHTADMGRQLALRLSGLAESFRGDAQRGVGESQAQTEAFVGATREGAAARRAELIATVTQVKEQATEQLVAMLDGIPQAVEQKAADEYKQKEDKLQDKAAKLFDAFDGVGTEEGDIHQLLAEASYGEIEAIEATYNRQYAERADDGMTPLRYDIADEMSGEERGAAMAFLRHDRQTAIRLTLASATGFFNDEEDTIRAVLKTCSDEEIEHLNTSPEGQAVIADVRDSLGGCDLDVVDTYLDTSLSREDRLTRVTAIELYEASVDQMGTDEDKVEQLLEGAKTEEERRRLRAAYSQYTEERLAEQIAMAEARGDQLMVQQLQAQQGKDQLAAMLESEFSGYEQTVVEQLAAEERNETAIDAARLLEGGEGAGTDEKGMLDALQDDSAESQRLQDALNDPNTSEEQKARIRAELEALARTRHDELNRQLSELSGGEETSVEVLLYQEFFDVSPQLAMLSAHRAATYQDVLDGNRPPFLTDAVLGYMVGLRKLKQGFAEPELELMYACRGGGSNEELIKSALSSGGKPRSKSEIDALRARFQEVWGESLASHNEMSAQAQAVWDNPDQYQDYDDFTAPSGMLDGELAGRDWLDVRVLLCGEPQTPAEKNYITLLKTTFEMDGAGDSFIGGLDALGFTDKASHLEAVRERYRQSAKTMREMELGDEQLSDLEAGRRGGEGGELTEEERDAVENFGFQGAALEQAAESYGQFKSSVISGIITALEIVAAVVVSVVTAGAGTALLGVILANAAVGVGAIALKRVALGATYGVDQMALDAAIAVGAAAVSELKVFSKLGKAGVDDVASRALTDAAAETGTALSDDVIRVSAGAAEEAGQRVISGTAGDLAVAARAQADTAVARVTAREGAEQTTEAAARVTAREGAEQTTEAAARESAEAAAGRSAGEIAEQGGESAMREAAERGAGAAGRAAAREGTEQAAEAATKKTLQQVALEELDKAVWSTLWERVTSEQTWEGKPFDVLGEVVRTMAISVLKGMIADRVGGAIPGLNRERGTHLGGALQAGAKGVVGHTTGTIIDQAMAEMMDPSTDAGKNFWESFLQGIPKAFADGASGHLSESLGAQAAAGHAARQAARDYIAGRKSADDLEAMHQAGELSDDQVRQLVGYVEENQHDLEHLPQGDAFDGTTLNEAIGLPDSFQTLAADRPTQGPAPETATNRNETEAENPARRQSVDAAEAERASTGGREHGEESSSFVGAVARLWQAFSDHRERRAYQRWLEENPGRTDGQVTRRDFLGDPPTLEERNRVRASSRQDSDLSLDEHRALIETGTARSARDMLVAAEAGEIPRFVARVTKTGYGTFANPKRPFNFATEPADLRGITNPAEAVLKIGWTEEWMRKNIGADIEIVIFDTHASESGSASGASAQVQLGGADWPDVRAEVMGNETFKKDAAASTIPVSEDELGDILTALSRTPVGAEPDVPSDMQPKVAIVRQLLTDYYSINPLYSGMGATVGEDGQLGGRELMLRHGDHSLKLTEENSERIYLGTLTEADIDAIFR